MTFYCLYANLLAMPVQPVNIIPITQARGKLGILAEKTKGENYIILTKSGSPKAALVNLDYLNKLQEDVGKIYRKTFIDPSLLPLTREFTKKELEEWQKEDEL